MPSYIPPTREIYLINALTALRLQKPIELRILCLSDCNLTDSLLEKLFNYLGDDLDGPLRTPELQKLDISHNKIENPFYLLKGKNIRFPNLGNLNLSYNPMSKEGYDMVACLFGRESKLQELSLAYPQGPVKSSNFIPIVKALEEQQTFIACSLSEILQPDKIGLVTSPRVHRDLQECVEASHLDDKGSNPWKFTGESGLCEEETWLGPFEDHSGATVQLCNRKLPSDFTARHTSLVHRRWAFLANEAARQQNLLESTKHCSCLLHDAKAASLEARRRGLVFLDLAGCHFDVSFSEVLGKSISSVVSTLRYLDITDSGNGTNVLTSIRTAVSRRMKWASQVRKECFCPNLPVLIGHPLFVAGLPPEMATFLYIGDDDRDEEKEVEEKTPYEEKMEKVYSFKGSDLKISEN
eukprot:GHVP01013758.1.p1 GENE.GHVP01013758.1~~GHVP01013758.1.p1  ORF type:complete len:410 (+),score=61.13 GHVP01013758.1:986-2215(+)